MNIRKIIGLVAITIVVAAVGSVAALGGKFPGIDLQSRDNVTNAIKANDYNAWQAAMSAQITQDNFNTLVQRYQNMSQRYENMSENQGTMFSGRQALNAEMIQAIKDGNYDAWKTAVVNSKSPLVSKITNEDEFKILVQLYQAKQDGNITKVMELSEQLGLPGGFEPRGFPDFNPGMNMSNNSRPPGDGHRMHAPFGREG
jgi:DNA-binding transcriptional regulator YbjK